MLEAFARRRGVPLRRSELFDLVWGAEHPGLSNVVDVYVGYLRRKLDLDDDAVRADRDRPWHRLPDGGVMRRWGVRTRLTVAVTAIFAIASIVAGVMALRITEDRLLADTRANAEQMLSDYVTRLYGGTAAAPTVDADESTSFFFLDAVGSELSERQYVTTLLADRRSAGTSHVVGAPGRPPCRHRRSPGHRR